MLRFSLLMIVPHVRSGEYGLFLLMIVTSILMFLGVIMAATARLVMGETGFSYRDLFQRWQLDWDEVTWVRVLPTGYVVSNITVYAGRRQIWIPLSVMGNPIELENAMCRFAAAANPGVRITGH